MDYRTVLSHARRRHGVITHAQLVELGYSPQAVKHLVGTARLHPVARGVYAVGRPDLPPHGRWTGAVLACGPRAVLSHGSAAALWGIGDERIGVIEVSVPARGRPRRPRIVAHRRTLEPHEVAVRDGIPLTAPIRTLVDIACRLGTRRLVRVIREADALGLCDPETLRAALDDMRGQRGVGVLRRLLDRHTFALTDSELERRFLPIARRAGLPKPKTQRVVNGFRVDFYWPGLGLVVETDGLRYHRTPEQQAADRVRDQAHLAAGLTPLRFTHAQVAYESRHVETTLSDVAARLR
ncbi:MAG TPA: type IV toxin-antitoxin system AbiEi family antitoxin domain-containing protein [Solirubrobacterales bacterium]|nr:type IV toxin-antitoxin system AbiEi family antitoxin domain-containing protein [Solirubrobacterales bacterium]